MSAPRAAANLHELARDAVDPLRREFPQTLLDLEHRGDAAVEWEGAALEEALRLLARHAFAHGAAGESIWMRTSGGESEVFAAIEWRGEGLPADTTARLQEIAAAHAGDFALEPRAELLRAVLRIARR